MLSSVVVEFPDSQLTAHPPNHLENSTLHRDLIDSGQDADSTTVDVHKIILFEVTAANALGARQPS